MGITLGSGIAILDGVIVEAGPTGGGQLYSWGQNANGQLGLNNATNYSHLCRWAP